MHRVLISCGALIASMISANVAVAAVTHATLYEFPGGGDGASPYGGLLRVGGMLYGTTGYGGTKGRGAVIAVNSTTGAESVVYSFKGGSDGYYPQSGLILVNGLLYGTTAYGGTGLNGTVYLLDPKTGTERVLYSFDRKSGANGNTPLYFDGGYLYGMTYGGGVHNEGTIFKVDIRSGAETTLHTFTGHADGCNGGFGALIQVGGLLYGTTIQCGAHGSGVLFSVDPQTGSETVLHAFGHGADGVLPIGGVIAVGSLLYGTTGAGGTNGLGTVYAFDLAQNAESVLYNFTGGADGAGIYTGVVYASGMLYGATPQGGLGFGSVFGVNATSGAETTLYDFTGGSDGGFSESPVILKSGKLYGMTMGRNAGQNSGSVFAVTIARHSETTLHEFTGPDPYIQSNSALLPVGGQLYGTTGNGGDAQAGTIYQLDPASGAVTQLYSFTAGADGTEPFGGLTAESGVLYGAARLGGSGNGTIFALSLTDSSENTAYTFSGAADGGQPNGKLAASGGRLYGTTGMGGANGAGTLFAFDPAKQKLDTLYDFGGAMDAATPVIAPVEHGGVLYGSTMLGGAYGVGAVYAYDLKTRVESVLYSFTGGTDGLFPETGVIYANGLLYGNTTYGGACSHPAGCGVIYSIDPQTGAEAVLYTFTGRQDGLFPISGLTYRNGTLFGGTSNGGFAAAGNVFSFDIASSAFQTLFTFSGGADGFDPDSVLLDLDGNLIGTTEYGGKTGGGVIFSIRP